MFDKNGPTLKRYFLHNDINPSGMTSIPQSAVLILKTLLLCSRNIVETTEINFIFFKLAKRVFSGDPKVSKDDRLNFGEMYKNKMIRLIYSIIRFE